MIGPVLVDAVADWLTEARAGQAAHVRPEVWADTAAMMTRAAQAATGAADPHHAAAAVGWSIGWARGAPVGVEEAANIVLADLQGRELRLEQWAAQIEAQAAGRPWEPADGWDEDRVAAGRYTRAEEQLARAEHALADLHRLRQLTGDLRHRPDPDPLIPSAPAVPDAVLTTLDQAAQQVTDPAAQLVGFTATAWEIGTQTGRAAGTVTALNHVARAASAQRIRRMPRPGPVPGFTPQDWARRSLAPAYAYLTRVLGEHTAIQAGLVPPPPAEPPRPAPHLAALLDAFPRRPRPAAPGAPPGLARPPAEGPHRTHRTR